MNTVTVQYYGVHGTGATVKEARANAGRKVQAAMERHYSPTLVKWCGMLGIVLATPEGWTYTIVWPDTTDGTNSCPCIQGARDDRAEVLRRMKRHMADNCTDAVTVRAFLIADDTGFVDWQCKQRFVAAYKAARSQGMDEGAAHQYACAHMAA